MPDVPESAARRFARAMGRLDPASPDQDRWGGGRALRSVSWSEMEAALASEAIVMVPRAHAEAESRVEGAVRAEDLARALLETETEGYGIDGWDIAPQEVQDAFLAWASRAIERLGDEPE